ncbi:MAG: hypothetical protein JKY43_04060 [Phycisphaerales bacterium]|nr:hypothetical protein [Phycisphaerales bacterium]
MAKKTIFELDLVKIAVWYQRCMLYFLLVLVAFVVLMVAVGNASISPMIEMLIGLLYIGFLVLNVVFVVKLQHACGTGVVGLIVYGVLAILLHVFVLITTLSRAGMILRLAGAKSGFFGVGKDEWDKLRVGHCRGCEYSREGLELLQECPECERVPQVI